MENIIIITDNSDTLHEALGVSEERVRKFESTIPNELKKFDNQMVTPAQLLRVAFETANPQTVAEYVLITYVIAQDSDFSGVDTDLLKELL